MAAKWSKSSFCGAYWRRRKHPKKDRKRDGSDSISIFPSRVWTNIFWCTVLKITATQSTDFVIAKNTESMEAECVRVGLHKYFASHRIKKNIRCAVMITLIIVNCILEQKEKKKSERYKHCYDYVFTLKIKIFLSIKRFEAIRCIYLLSQYIVNNA